MERVICIALILGGMSVHLFGQETEPKRTAEERAQKTVLKLSERIPLAESKKDSLSIAFATFYKEMQAARKSGSKAQFNTLEASRNTQVKQILADEQLYQEYINFVEEMKAKRQQFREDDRKEGRRRRVGSN